MGRKARTMAMKRNIRTGASWDTNWTPYEFSSPQVAEDYLPQYRKLPQMLSFSEISISRSIRRRYICKVSQFPLVL